MFRLLILKGELIPHRRGKGLRSMLRLKGARPAALICFDIAIGLRWPSLRIRTFRQASDRILIKIALSS